MNNNPIIKPEFVPNPFKYFCTTIGYIPTSYKDSLDYYEQLLWLVKFLENKVIPAVDNNALAVTELQGLYIQLKNYVDHYFDNLDLQEEVNNKLDEMAASGELNELIHKLDDFSNSNKINAGNNLLTNSSLWVTNDGWTGNSINGFAHIVGQSTDLVYNYDFEANKTYVVDFDVETTQPAGSDNAGNDFSVVIGDTNIIPTYRGGGSMHYTIGLAPKTAGPLKFVCVNHGTLETANTFVGTIKNITLKEVTGSLIQLAIKDINDANSLPFSIMLNANDTVAIGTNAGIKNYNQSQNTYIGSNAGSNDITGYRNVAIGGEALYNTINGSRNVAVGYRSMWKNESGDRNIGIGAFAMSGNKTGRQNIVLGFDTFMTATDGNNNIVIGNQALGGANYSKENIAIGWGCMASSNPTSDGIRNIAIGDHAGNYLTTGYNNLFLGYHAGYKNTTGNRNIAIGNTALNDNQTANRLIAIGEACGNKITTGEFSVIIGENMGTGALTSMSNSNLIGNSVGNNITSLSNSTIIGNRVTANTSKTDFSNILVLNAGTSQAYISKDNYMNIANLIYGNIDSSKPQVGIKQTDPTAILHLGAGTAGAGKAPLKFTAGTNLATPEDGALEYDGTHLYFTIGSTRNTII